MVPIKYPKTFFSPVKRPSEIEMPISKAPKPEQQASLEQRASPKGQIPVLVPPAFLKR